jgi:NAD+ diphosphatase
MVKNSIYQHYQIENRPKHDDSSKAYWFIFNSDEMLVNVENGEIPFLEDLNELEITPMRKIYLGTLYEHPCYVAEVKENHTPEGMVFDDLRILYNLLDPQIYLLAGRAVQILNWDKNHQYCGKCGTKTKTMDHEMAKVCPDCGLINYTRISPAVITAIIRDGKLLMAKHNYGRYRRYGLIAGFVEAGETLEEAVQREILEEVGLHVKNIQYFGSQAWPFPNSLMLGFTAEYDSGEITVDGNEIAHARWFGVEELPELPSRISIARELIDWYLENYAEDIY